MAKEWDGSFFFLDKESDDYIEHKKQIQSTLNWWEWRCWLHWHRVEMRQKIWRAAVAAFQYTVLRPKFEQMGERVAQAREQDDASYGSPQGVDEESQDQRSTFLDRVYSIRRIEKEVFGFEVTKAFPSFRLQFWDFVELLLRNQMPSDLAVERPTQQLFAQHKAAIEQKLLQYEGRLDNGGHTHALKGELEEFGEWFFHLITGPAPGSYREWYCERIRQYANIYLSGDYSPMAYSKPVLYSGMLYLTQPHEERPQDEGDYQTLSYWRRYGVVNLRQLPPIIPYTAQPRLLEQPIALPEKFNWKDRFDTISIATRLYPHWPLSSRGVITAIAQRYPSPRSALPRPYARRIADIEREFFDREITTGHMVHRVLFWLWLYGVSQGMVINKETLCSVNKYAGIEWPGEEISQRVQRVAAKYLAEGYDPMMKCKLLDYPTASLSQPRAADDPVVLAEPIYWRTLHALLTRGTM